VSKYLAGWKRAIALSGASLLALSTPAQAGAVQASTGDVSPLYGRINPFYGSVNTSYGRINPFYGRINPFYGRINPFFGDVSPFWGRINPFTQATDASTLGFYGTAYNPFWGSASPYLKPMANGLNYGSLAGFWTSTYNAWTPILANWNAATTTTQAAAVATQIQNGLVTPANAFWGPVIAKSGPAAAKTQALLGRHLTEAGITFNADGSINAASLLNSDASKRAMLFLNVYDDLMDLSGTGHVDWWMGRVGWSPALAQIQGKTASGAAVPTVGMIDLAVTVSVGADGKPIKGTKLSKQIVQYGSTVFDNGHGAAVGSLIMGAVDGSGVLGIMPAGSVRVLAYDPYDETGTTNWTDVGTGIATLTSAIFKGATTPLGVLNASLGEPGYTLSPGWNDALANAGAAGRNLVVAAGNDGVTQTANVKWNFANNPNLIIVGSVGADGTISNFSNRPGEACLLPTTSTSTVCAEANKLKYRFIVAPGELILVSDGVGGHVRQSGTSLAAPLVSGAIAMLQNRWPWLSNYPNETASIILKSATPKGTKPGADPVYGVGELNVVAAQSPLSWSNLVYFPMKNGSLPTPVATVQKSTNRDTYSWNTLAKSGVSLQSAVTQQSTATQSSWNASGASYVAFEKVGATFRDFQIPLSSKLVGQTVTTLGGGQSYQSYLSAAFRSQIGHFATLDANPAGTSLFANGFERSSVPAGTIGAMQLRANVSATGTTNGFRTSSGMPYETGMTLAGEHSALQFGFGNGAAALDTSASFAFRNDHNLAGGGVNPVLGLASGGAYLGGRMEVVPGLAFGFGTTQRTVWRNPDAFGYGALQAGSWVNRYAANAQTVNVRYAVTPRLIAHAGYTRLREQNALLGIQSLSQSDLRGGSATNGATIGFDLRLEHGVTLSGSGTLARTDASGGQLTADRLTGAAAAFAVTKNGVFGRGDQLRLTAATPLHTVAGQVRYSSLGVIDRDTGDIGVVTQALDVRSRQMPLTGEIMYGGRLSGVGLFSLFGRIERANQLAGSANALGAMGGAQLQIGF